VPCTQQHSQHVRSSTLSATITCTQQQHSQCSNNMYAAALIVCTQQHSQCSNNTQAAALSVQANSIHAQQLTFMHSKQHPHSSILEEKLLLSSSIQSCDHYSHKILRLKLAQIFFAQINFNSPVQLPQLPEYLYSMNSTKVCFFLIQYWIIRNVHLITNTTIWCVSLVGKCVSLVGKCVNYYSLDPFWLVKCIRMS